MRREDEIRLRHMIEAAETALQFIEGRQRADLDKDRMLLFALVRAVEIIGEAASRIGPETRSNFAEIPWSDIVSMRNRLVHAYFDIDHDILWKTIELEIPPMLARLRRVRLTD